MAQTTKESVRCVQRLGGGRQCRRTATHYLPTNPKVATCTQHARSYDVPFTREGQR